MTVRQFKSNPAVLRVGMVSMNSLIKSTNKSLDVFFLPGRTDYARASLWTGDVEIKEVVFAFKELTALVLRKVIARQQLRH